MIFLEAFLLGFFVKVITGIDDMLTRVPVIAALARTRRGKVAFSAGAVCAVSVAIGFAYFFSEAIHELPYYRSAVAGLIIALAVAIKFDLFVHKPRENVRRKIEKKIPQVSFDKLRKLFFVGFIATITTVLDDVIAYLPVFFGEPVTVLVGIAGILAATVAQAIVVIYFAEKIARIPYKEEIAAAGLLVLALLILLGVI